MLQHLVVFRCFGVSVCACVLLCVFRVVICVLLCGVVCGSLRLCLSCTVVCGSLGLIFCFICICCLYVLGLPHHPYMFVSALHIFYIFYLWPRRVHGCSVCGFLCFVACAVV